jgi:hypothetical protein
MLAARLLMLLLDERHDQGLDVLLHVPGQPKLLLLAPASLADR